MLELMGVFLAGLLIFHWLERFAPVMPHYHGGPKRRGYLADITAALVDGPVLSSISKIIALYVILQLPQLQGGMDEWAWGWQFTLFFLVNDFGRYWLHRWYHEFNSLWRVHRVHHTIVHMDALSTSRVHLLEGVIKYGLLVMPFHFLGVSRSVAIVYSSLDILKGFWHHANLRTYIGPLNYVFNSAELHWWHHCVEAKGQRANYGSILSIWDLMFGTFYWPRGEWPKEIGVVGMDAFPDDYIGQATSIRYSDDQLLERLNRTTPVAGAGADPAPPLAPQAAPQSQPAPALTASEPAQPPAPAAMPHPGSLPHAGHTPHLAPVALDEPNAPVTAPVPATAAA